MAKKLCVFSTLAASVRYVDYEQRENGMSVERGSVLVKGGAGVADAHIHTPRGVATMVTEQEAELLKRNELFKLHAKNGFVALDAVEDKPSQDTVDNAAAALTGRDVSAPTVAEDFTVKGDKPPSTTKPAKRG